MCNLYNRLREWTSSSGSCQNRPAKKKNASAEYKKKLFNARRFIFEPAKTTISDRMRLNKIQLVFTGKKERGLSSTAIPTQSLAEMRRYMSVTKFVCLFFLSENKCSLKKPARVCSFGCIKTLLFHITSLCSASPSARSQASLQPWKATSVEGKCDQSGQAAS